MVSDDDSDTDAEMKGLADSDADDDFPHWRQQLQDNEEEKKRHHNILCLERVADETSDADSRPESHESSSEGCDSKSISGKTFGDQTIQRNVQTVMVQCALEDALRT